MAFPVVLMGSEGEQFNTYTDERWALGTQLILQDGRKFRFAKAGGSTLVVGNLIQAAANTANHVDVAGVASAIGSISPSVTLGATSAAANLYAEGYAITTKTPDGARLYRIDNHASNTGSAALVINFSAGYSLVAAWTTATNVSLLKNPYDSVIQAPNTTLTNSLLGIACSAPTSANFGWLATSGTTPALQNGTLVLGQAATASAAAAGVVGPAATSAAFQTALGTVRQVSSATWSPVQLILD